MKFILPVLMLVAGTRGFAQFSSPPAIEWQRAYGGKEDDIGYAISSTDDGGYIMCGCTGSIDGDIALKTEEALHGSKCDFWYAKLDGSGSILFAHNPGGTGSDVARSTRQTADGGYIIAGGAESDDVDVVGNHGDFDFWIVKLNTAGDISWTKCYGGSLFEDYGGMDVTDDGGYVFAGGTHSSNGDVSGNHGSSDFWLVKTDAAGTVLWSQCYGGTGYEKAFDVKQVQDGGYLMAGFSESNDGQVTGNHSADYDGWVVKTDASGVFLWGKCFGGISQDGFYKVTELNDGSFWISGYTYSSDGDLSANHGADDAWLLKMDQNGNLIWSKNFGGTNSEAFQTLRQDAGGMVVAAGYSRSFDGDLDTNYGEWDYWLLRFDTEGSILWDTVYGGSLSDVGYDFDMTGDGGIIMNGYTLSNAGDVTGNHGKKDFWVARLANVVKVPEVMESTTTVHPALAHDWITVSGIAGRAGQLNYDIFSADGRIQETMVLSADHRIHVSSLIPGMYFILLSDEKSRLVARFMKY